MVGLTITTEEGVHFAPTVAEVKTAFLSKGLEFISPGGTELAESDHVGTGTVIRFAGSSSDEQLTVIVKGDLDGDGYVTNRDASRAARYLINKETLNETQIAAVDVTGDGKVNNRDASFLARFLVGKEII